MSVTLETFQFLMGWLAAEIPNTASTVIVAQTGMSVTLETTQFRIGWLKAEIWNRASKAVVPQRLASAPPD